MQLNHYFSNAKWTGTAIASVSAALLGGAFVFQYGFDMAPCPLCIYQRWPHGIVIVLGLAALALSRTPKKSALLIALATLPYLAGTALGIYHVGVEQHWWASALEACTAGTPSTGDLLKQIESTRAVRCDAIAWSMLGISMAGYNALISGAMALYCLIASIRITRRVNGY